MMLALIGRRGVLALLGWQRGGLFILLALIIVWVFSPAFSAQYLNWDDEAHFFDNPLTHLSSWNDFLRIFYTTDSVNNTYIPLTILSFSLERYFFGVSPFISHLLNLFFHMGTAFLVVILGLRLGLSRTAAFFAALLFAIHPMRVESVVWVTERKDVLFGLFYVAALVAYLKYVEQRSFGFYLLALLCGIFSVLSKPMALSLPFILFLCDWLRMRKGFFLLILEKLPFMLAVWSIAGITLIMNTKYVSMGSTSSLWLYFWSALFYVRKFLEPWAISVYYAPPDTGQTVSAVLLFVLIGVFLWLTRKDRWPRFAVLFYVFSAFFIWRHNLMEGSRGLVHDRFMYIPLLGFALCFGAYLDKYFCNLSKVRRIINIRILIVSVGFVFLAWHTFSRCWVWEDSLVYWNEYLRKDPQNPLGLLNRSIALLDPELALKYRLSGKEVYNLAERDLRLCAKLTPWDADVFHDLGVILEGLERKEEALNNLNKAIIMDANQARYFNDRANFYFRSGDYYMALKDYESALQINPGFESALFNKELVLKTINAQEVKSDR